MSYIIKNATPGDLEVIYNLFEAAIEFQKANNYIGWSGYDKEYIKSDIANGLLFKMTINDTITCIFSICYTDDLIWRQKETGDAIYLHRVVLNRQFAGNKLFGKILDWLIPFARNKQLDYIRIDTWADNEKIITYYKSYGFKFVENYTTPDTESLPTQHRNLHVALFELSLPPIGD